MNIFLESIFTPECSKTGLLFFGFFYAHAQTNSGGGGHSGRPGRQTAEDRSPPPPQCFSLHSLIQHGIIHYQPIRGSSWIPTPSKLAGKRAIINVKNLKDENCIIYSILASTRATDIKRGRGSCGSSYTPFIDDLNTSGLYVQHQSRFETKNELTINVYTSDASTASISPLQLSKRWKKNPINLLLITDVKTELFHYVLITSLSWLLNSKNSNQYTFCPHCLVGFRVKNNGYKRMSKHIVNCYENDAVKVVYPPIDKQTIQFRRHVAQQEKVLTLYADFETWMKTTMVILLHLFFVKTWIKLKKVWI